MEPKVANAEDVEEDVWDEGRFGSRAKDLGRVARSEKVGLRVEIISPGRQSAPEHAHYAEEEIFLVLGGRGSLLHDGGEFPVRRGDVVVYPRSGKTLVKSLKKIGRLHETGYFDGEL